METQEINLDKFNLDYSAVFVPFSQSRSKDNKEKSLNWLVTVKRGNASLTTDYMEGIGHVKGYKQLWSKVTVYEKKSQDKIIDWASEKGKTGSIGQSFGDFLPSGKLPTPELKDVLHSLLMDAEVLNYSGFEEWSNEFGYDSDSRSAEKIYQACLKIALQFKQIFNEQEIEELQEIFQDY